LKEGLFQENKPYYLMYGSGVISNLLFLTIIGVIYRSNSSMDTTLKEKHLGTHSQLKKLIEK